jgi:hypothetical protein
MKEITEVPVNYDSINNLEMRSLFENTDDQPLIYIFFQATGNVSNEANEQGGESYAIEVFNDDGDLIYSFIYNSLFEYEEDCRILGISKFAERYKITARITGQEKILELQKFELNNFRDGSDYVGENEFDSEQEAKDHLILVAKKYYDREEYSNMLNNELSKIEAVSMLQIGKVWARMELIEKENESDNGAV